MSSVKQRNRILETDLTTLKGKVVKVKELVNPGGAVVFLVRFDTCSNIQIMPQLRCHPFQQRRRVRYAHEADKTRQRRRMG